MDPGAAHGLRGRLAGVAIAVTLAAAGAVRLASVAAGERWTRFCEPPWDAALDGREVPRISALGAFLDARAASFAESSAALRADEDVLSVSLADLGITLDVPATRAAIERLPRATDFGQRLRRALSGPPLDLASVTPVWHFDRERAERTLVRLAPALHRKVVNARLVVNQHRRIDDEPGRELVIDASLDAIANGARGPGAVYTLAFEREAPRITVRDLPPVDVSRVVGSYETSFLHHGGARAVNIRTAAARLDGTLLPPGARFSFNRTVGERTEEHGFVKAPVIVNDETEPGLGGGVCQVATTLHAAAVFAGLSVLERRSHSRASGYAPLGLDATVIDGKVDLRLQNPYDTTLMIHATLPTSSTIRVEILGREPPASAEHAYRVVERHAFYRRIVEKPDFDAGSFERKQKGSYGYDIVSVVSLTWGDGSIRKRQYKSKYYPVPEVFWVGHGTEAESLPPLPDGAAGLEPAPPLPND